MIQEDGETIHLIKKPAPAEGAETGQTAPGNVPAGGAAAGGMPRGFPGGMAGFPGMPQNRPGGAGGPGAAAGGPAGMPNLQGLLNNLMG